MDKSPAHVAQVRNYFAAGKTQRHKKGGIILSVEDEPQYVYYILSGYVRIYSINARKEEYTHVVYGPNEIFPLVWLIQKRHTNVFYEAMEEVELRYVPIEQINHDLQADAGLAYNILQMAIEQYRIYSMRVDNLEYKYASERLAYRLILLANRFSTVHDGETTIVPVFTHQVLGSTLNLSRESVSREMEKLLRRGLVRYNRERQIVIPDLRELSTQLQVPLQQGLSLQRSPDKAV